MEWPRHSKYSPRARQSSGVIGAMVLEPTARGKRWCRPRGYARRMGLPAMRRRWAAVVSIAIAGGVAAALLGIASAAGWLTLDAETERSEVALGILLLAIGALLSGALHQMLSSDARGPEILLGQLVVLVAFVLVGSMFDGRYQRSAVGFGMVMIAAMMASMCQVGARLTWTFRDETRRR
jgi:prepilin signal peptidase PulO-like enzyme (type II secretory pathway)